MKWESLAPSTPHRIRNFIVSLVVVVLLISCTGWAQTTSIAGVVGDPSGAVISSANVVAENSERSWRKQCTTGEDGSFDLPVPAPGHYQLRIEAPGFKPYVQNNLVIDGTGKVVLNVGLVLNSESTTVEVSADRLQIDLSDAERGETIGSTKMTSVPLNGRSFTDLVGIQPGIVPTSSQQPNAVLMSGVTSTPPSGDLNAGNLSISGQRETSNGFRVNGSDVEEDVNMGTAIVPNLDSVQEFRVLTSNFDAQYGNYSGGQVLLLTKTGTNQLHGDMFEFVRNTNLDARNYFSAQRAQFSQIGLGEPWAGLFDATRSFSSAITKERG